MTTSAILLVPVMLAAVTYLTWVVFVAVPDNLTTLYQIKMQRIRDDAVDELLAKRAANPVDAHSAATAAELLILLAPSIRLPSAVYLFTGPVVRSMLVRRRAARTAGCGATGKPAGNGKRLPPHLRKVAFATFWRPFTASLPGWIVLACVFGVLIPIMYISRLEGRADALQVRIRRVCEEKAAVMLQMIQAASPRTI